MERFQALDILERISSVYPSFDLHEKRIEVWCEQLKDMPYKKVLHRLNQHIAESKFPPTVAEIAVKPKPKNEALDKFKQWEREVEHERKHRS